MKPVMEPTRRRALAQVDEGLGFEAMIRWMESMGKGIELGSVAA